MISLYFLIDYLTFTFALVFSLKLSHISFNILTFVSSHVFTLSLSHFHLFAGCLNLGSATCSSCQVNTTLKSSLTVMVIVWKIYILKYRYHQYCIQIIIDMIVVDMQICILMLFSAPPTLLRFLTLIFPSPPHLLLQSGHHHHDKLHTSSVFSFMSSALLSSSPHLLL